MSTPLITFISILLVPAALVAWMIAKTVRGSRAHRASCGGCGYEVASNPAGLTRCPECGREFVEVGIKAPRRTASRSRASLAVELGLWMVVLAILLFFPLAAMWPIQGEHMSGSYTYAPPARGRVPVDQRQVRVEEVLSYTIGGPAYAGVVTIGVTGPGGAAASLSIDVATLAVTAADPGVQVSPGKALPQSGLRALYDAAGIDTATDSQIAGEADAMQKAIIAGLNSPSISNHIDISGGGLTATLTSQGSRSEGYSTGPFVVLWGKHFSMIPVYGALVIACYVWLLRRTLAAKRTHATGTLDVGPDRGLVPATTPGIAR